MAVSIPSDLIVDVMRSADPQRVKLAVARLQNGATSPAGPTPPPLQTFADFMPPLKLAPDVASDAAKSSSARAGFEKMVISNMLENILPRASSGVFGEDSAGSIWRSMFSDSLADAYAKQGGLGIADLVSRDAAAATPDTGKQWPYFKLPALRSFGA